MNFYMVEGEFEFTIEAENPEAIRKHFFATLRQEGFLQEGFELHIGRTETPRIAAPVPKVCAVKAELPKVTKKVELTKPIEAVDQLLTAMRDAPKTKNKTKAKAKAKKGKGKR